MPEITKKNKNSVFVRLCEQKSYPVTAWPVEFPFFASHSSCSHSTFRCRNRKLEQKLKVEGISTAHIAFSGENLLKALEPRKVGAGGELPGVKNLQDTYNLSSVGEPTNGQFSLKSRWSGIRPGKGVAKRYIDSVSSDQRLRLEFSKEPEEARFSTPNEIQ